jgi:3-phenylpropionate/trans-cinnamate dioxygenase ferredoxin reductase component
MPDVVIVGAGLAGVNTIFGLRSAGFAGSITLIGDETSRPYDRPPLSKRCMTEADFSPPSLLTEVQQAELKVTLRSGTVVTSIDRKSQSISTHTGEQIDYRHLVLATGAAARRLTVPGAEHALVLRTDTDARAIRDSLTDGARVVVIGGGFIGLEVAASARELGCTVTVVEAGPRVLTRGVPKELSEAVATEHKAKGVDIRLNAMLVWIQQSQSGEFTIDLATGEQLFCDVVVAGVGATPNTQLAESAGLTVANGIVVDEHMRTSDPAIFAIGDCSSFQHPLFDRRMRLEAWRNAVDHALAVSKTIMQNSTATSTVPWFWSDQFDLGIQVSGLPDQATKTVVRERVDGARIWFGLTDDGRLISAAALGRGTSIARDIRLAERLIAAGARPSVNQLVDPTIEMKQIVAGVSS